MEITKREILFSITILCGMIGLGVILSRPIISSTTEKAFNIISAVQIKDSVKFDYIRRTNVGDFLAEGKLITDDPVSIEDIAGQYSKIKKNKEEYRKHTRTVTETDSKGNVHTRQETYWTWDVVKTWTWESKRVNFLGKTFSPSDIGYNFYTKYQETIDPHDGVFHTDIRYKYYTCPVETCGVMRGVATDKTFKNLRFEEKNTIANIIKKANNQIKGAPIGFWIFWGLLTVGVIVLFYYFDNKWLEDETENTPSFYDQTDKNY